MSLTTPTAEQYLDIPLDQLHDSPTQPRLTYDEAYLDELAADIKSHGRNLSPLLVRPRVPELFAAVGDADLARDATAGYEIVFGHCRRRGLERAGLTHARCEVRSMADEQVERAQISENLQRKNVHPFEEAQGFQALIDRHGDTPDAIAERTGKSRTYVYSRLKLLQACDEVRKSCVAGEIGAEVALLIARLRHAKLQAKALARIKAKYWDLKDGGQKSFRNIRDLLNEEFTLDLKSAPFPIDVVLANSGPCPTCPKRSANAPEFQDVAEDAKRSPYSRQNLGPNVCTDPDCFSARKVAHFANKAAELRAAGKLVVDGNKARTLVSATGEIKGGYVPLSKVSAAMKAREKAVKKGHAIYSPPPVTLIQDPRTGKVFEAVSHAELVRTGLAEEAPAASKPAKGGNSRHDPEAYRLQRQQAEERANQLTGRNRIWLQAVREAAQAQARSEFDMRLICHWMLEQADECGDAGLSVLLPLRGVSLHELRGQIELLPASELALLMLDLVLCRDCDVDSWSVDTQPEALMIAASHYGVDLQALDADPASTPSAAARASKGTEDDEGQGAAPAADVDGEKGESQAGSAGEEKGGAGGAEAGQVEEEGAEV